MGLSVLLQLMKAEILGENEDEEGSEGGEEGSDDESGSDNSEQVMPASA